MEEGSEDEHFDEIQVIPPTSSATANMKGFMRFRNPRIPEFLRGLEDQSEGRPDGWDSDRRVGATCLLVDGSARTAVVSPVGEGSVILATVALRLPCTPIVESNQIRSPMTGLLARGPKALMCTKTWEFSKSGFRKPNPRSSFHWTNVPCSKLI